MSIRDHISRLFPFALTFACLFLAYERPNQKVTFIAAADRDCPGRGDCQKKKSEGDNTIGNSK
ncbi:MAG: hypothetical protein GXX84_04950 [Acidobacteria bacterium]|nr:hypothetical protein [Acidobacteriota bacterium]